MNEEETKNEGYSAVRAEVLKANTPLTFDLYILVNQKYIHYVKKGDDLEAERFQNILDKLKTTNSQRLFISTEDQQSFQKFIEEGIDKIVESETKNPEEKFDIIQDIVENAIEVVFDQPESREAYKLTEVAASGLRKMIQANPKVLKKIFSKRDRDTALIVSHCKNVAALSCRLAFSLGFRGKDLDNLGNAALLHDLGLTKLKRDEQDLLFTRPPNIFSNEDKRIYQEHVNDGIKMLAGKKFVNNDIIELIRAHEEKKGGNGYPERRKDLEPLEEILSLVNCYEKKVMALKMGPIRAFKDMQIGEVGNYNLRFIKKLKEVLNSEEVFSLN